MGSEFTFDRLDQDSVYRRGTFDNFAVSRSNRAAVETSKAIAESPSFGRVFVIEAACGDGSTHLASAVMNRIGDLHPGVRRFVISSDRLNHCCLVDPAFGVELVQCAAGRSVVLIDTFSFCYGDRAIEQRMADIITKISECGGAVVISTTPFAGCLSSGSPLMSVFGDARVVSIQSPDADLRRSIVSNVSRRRGVSPSPEVIDTISSAAVRSARTVEAVTARCLALSAFLSRPLDEALVVLAIRGVGAA